MKKRINNIRVVKDEINPETPEVLAASLVKIGEAMQKLSQSGGLDDDALAILVANMRGMRVTKSEVKTVIEGLRRLKSYYIRK